MGAHVHQDPLSRPRRGPFSERGRINLLTVIIIMMAAVAVYLAVMLGPPYVEFYKFEEKLRAVANQAHREKDDEALLRSIQRETKILGLNLPYDAVSILRDPHGEWIEISARYNRVVQLVPFGMEHTLHFESTIVERL